MTVRIVISFQAMIDCAPAGDAAFTLAGPATVAISITVRNKLIRNFVDFVFIIFSFRKYLRNSHSPFDAAVAL
jgi:hypothetical protein